MRPTTSLKAFLAHRVGGMFRGAHFVYGFPHEGLALAVAVGRFDEEDLRSLQPLLEAALSFPQHDALWDITRVEHIVPEAFAALEGFLLSYFRKGTTARRVAVVARPHGLMRAVGAGLFSFLGPPYAVSTFADMTPALEWLGASPAIGDIAESEAERLAVGSFTTVVSAWIEGHVTSPSIHACARDLGVSVRTLQRRLTSHGSSFVAEANGARVRVAERSLAGTDVPLSAIARQVGFSSPQRFALVFRRIKGEPPSATRARFKSGSPPSTARVEAARGPRLGGSAGRRRFP